MSEPSSQIAVDLLIEGGDVLTMDPDRTHFADGAVAVRQGRIVAVGESSRIRAGVRASRTVDARGKVLLPGLINVHTHAAMTLFRGIADDIPLEPWLEHIWQLEAEFATEENVRLGAELAFAEMIRGGVTTAADMYWHREATNESARQMGFRLVNGPSFIDFVGPDGIQPGDREPLAREYLERYRGDSLIEACIQAHSAYMVPQELLELTGELAAEYGVLFITHAAESAAELKTVEARYGLTPIELLESMGLLGSKTLLAHCVHLKDSEIALLAERGSAVAHCPESNLKIGSGIARTAEMLAAGVTVGLGTDGVATNNDLDMWGEMRTAALLQKGVRFDPTVMTARQTLEMATIGGARALRMDDRIGSIEVGKRADLILVNLHRLHLAPAYDLFSHLVYAAKSTDVEMVVIDGKLLLEDGRLQSCDESALLDQARRAGERIAAAMRRS